MVASLFPFVASHALLAYGLACLKPASTSRLCLACIITVCCLVSVRSRTSQRIPGSIGNDYIIGFVLHASNFLLIARLSPPPQATKAGERARWAIEQLFHARWGVRNIPAFDSKRPNAVPSKRAFLAQRSIESACLGAALWLLLQYPLNILSQDLLLVPDGFLRRLPSVDSREVVIRLYIYVTAVAVPYCTLRLGHSLASIFAILCGGNVSRWPPLFGSISEAYTVRRLWAVFWHQLMRKAFTSHAIFITQRVFLRSLSPNANARRWTRHIVLLTSFCIVALMHIFASPTPSLCSAWPQFRFYGSTAAAIVAEDAIIGLGDSNSNSNKSSKSQPKKIKVDDDVVVGGSRKVRQTSTRPAAEKAAFPPNTVSRAWRWVGYAWVFGFDLWATTKLVYATAKCN